MKEAVIVSAVRTAVGKAPKGTLKNTRPDDLGAAAIPISARPSTTKPSETHQRGLLCA